MIIITYFTKHYLSTLTPKIYPPTHPLNSIVTNNTFIFIHMKKIIEYKVLLIGK